MRHTCIQTYTGKAFNFLDPTMETIDLIDIVKGLSRKPRYAAQSINPLTIAEHSILTSKLVPHKYAMTALFHDAPEAYLGDPPSTLKALLQPEFDEIHDNILKVMSEKFELIYPLPDEVKKADAIALSTEVRQCFPFMIEQWKLQDLPEPSIHQIFFFPPEKAELLFYERLNEIKNNNNIEYGTALKDDIFFLENYGYKIKIDMTTNFDSKLGPSGQRNIYKIKIEKEGNIWTGTGNTLEEAIKKVKEIL